MATSKAMGTGRNAANRATRRMPPMVTWATSAWGGKSSTPNAPRMAARIISGRATRATYQKLLRKSARRQPQLAARFPRKEFRWDTGWRFLAVFGERQRREQKRKSGRERLPV